MLLHALLLIVLYKASNRHQLLGSLLAEIPERETSGKLRAVERGIQRAIVLTVHIDASSDVNMRVTLPDHHPLLLRAVLKESEVILAVTCDHTIKVRAHAHTPRLT